MNYTMIVQRMWGLYLPRLSMYILKIEFPICIVIYKNAEAIY